MKNGLVNVICAMALLSGCPTETTPGTDSGPSGTDTGPVGTDAPPTGCTDSTGLPCLAVGSATANMPADMACTPSEPAAGTASDRTLRLVSFGTSTTPIPNGAFEIWPGNAVGATCTAPDCVALMSGTDSTVTTSLDDGYFAYRVPQNGAAMTYTAIGYNRSPEASGNTDIVTIPSSLFMTAIGLIRSGFMADPADGILTGDVTDCDGEAVRGATIRIFDSAGAEIDMSDTGALTPGLAYRRDGVLPSASLTTTDYSGGYAAGNLPILADPRVAVVAYGTTEMGGTRDIIGCEEVVIGTNAITILSFGPYRSDYPAGNLCLMHAPTP